MPRRHAALPLLVAVIVALLACKRVKVPAEYEALTPTKGLTKAIELKGSPGKRPSLMLWYKQDKISAQEVRNQFIAKARAQGYEQIYECQAIPDKPGDGLMKAPNQFLDFSILPLASSWDARMVKSNTWRSLKLPKPERCKWLAGAANHCQGGAPSPTGICRPK